MPHPEVKPGTIVLTFAVEGNPQQICHRTVYGSIDGLVRFELRLSTIGQPQVSSFMREVADQFALHEGSIIAGRN